MICDADAKGQGACSIGVRAECILEKIRNAISIGVTESSLGSGVPKVFSLPIITEEILVEVFNVGGGEIDALRAVVVEDPGFEGRDQC